MLRLYARICDLAAVTKAGLEDWLAEYVALVRNHRSHLYLFSMASASDKEVRAVVVAQRLAVIKMLGERYAAFRIESGDGLKAAECLLIMFQIEQVVSALAHEDAIPTDDMIRLVAAKLHAFLTGPVAP